MRWLGLVKAAFSESAIAGNKPRAHASGARRTGEKSRWNNAARRSNLVLVADPALKPGELFFETSQGTLDASVETQLREIERGLIDKLDR